MKATKITIETRYTDTEVDLEGLTDLLVDAMVEDIKKELRERFKGDRSGASFLLPRSSQKDANATGKG